MPPEISVVIPLYNKQSTIQRTLRSVLNQTFPNFEVIVVNDGSTDSSLQQAQAVEDGRIRIITQANAGECAARNRGIREARAEVVAFVDADDEWLPGFLEKIWHLRETFPACKLYAMAFDKVTVDPGKYRVKQSPYPARWEGVLEDYYHVLLTYTPFNASSVAVERETLLACGGFREQVLLRGDMELWVRLSAITPFAYANEVLSLYHLDAENRACEVHRDKDALLGEHLVTLEHLLRKDALPDKMRAEASRYLSSMYLVCVKNNLSEGKKPYARSLLGRWRFFYPDLRNWLRLVRRSL